MKCNRLASLVALAIILSCGMAYAGTSPASDVGADEIYRQQSDGAKMLHKLGRGVTNIFTCWVEIPRNIAIEWEKTDPFSGFFVGTVTGVGWGFARLATGVYDTVTFPFPVPANYQALLQPEFVVTDIWGDDIPDFTDMRSNDPKAQGNSPIYPQRFNF